MQRVAWRLPEQCSVVTREMIAAVEAEVGGDRMNRAATELTLEVGVAQHVVHLLKAYLSV